MPTVRITEDTTGSPRGSDIYSYEEGETLSVGTRRMTERLATILVDGDLAEWVESSSDASPEDGTPEGRETKPAGPEETKPTAPEEEKTVASYESSGSWKTFYDEDGWEVGKAQVSKEEAETAVEEGLPLEEVKEL